MNWLTSREQQQRIEEIEDKFNLEYDRLQSYLDKTEFKFIEFDVDHVVFSKVHWEAIPLEYSSGVLCRGKNFEDGATEIECRFHSGGYMTPHYHGRKEIITMITGELKVKIFRCGKVDYVKTLKEGETYTIHKNVIHAPESHKGCHFDLIWCE